MRPLDRRYAFAKLHSGAVRSEFEWRRLFGNVEFSRLLEDGVLEVAKGTAIDGREVEFEFDDGIRRYTLFFQDGRVVAHSVDGGSARDATFELVLRAVPRKYFEAVAARSSFELLSWAPGQPDHVGIMSRSIEGKTIKALVVLDDEWIDQFSASEWVLSISKDADFFVLLADERGTCPWPIKKPVVIRPLPLVKDQWAIPREIYSDLRIGISTTAIAALRPDKKVILNGVKKELCVFGRRIEIKSENRTYGYFKGILSLGASAVPEKFFAADHLSFYEDVGDEVRQARHSAKRALKIAFKDDSKKLEEALELFAPKSCPELSVQSGIHHEDFLILGVD